MKYRMMMLALCSLFIFCTRAHAQYRDVQASPTTELSLTGNLQYDLSTEMNTSIIADSIAPARKVVYKKKYSALRAGLFSAVLPGAGQFYTKSYWQSAAFFGAEVLMWVAYATYENSGDRKTAEFQKYADEHWSVIRYAYWIKNSAYGATYNTINGTTPIVPNGEPENTPLPWNYVNWAALNACEDAIGYLPIQSPDSYPNGTGFTHKLEPYGQQQYYELIGKYAQYGGGWDDAATFKSDASVFSSMDVLNQNVSPRFRAYSSMRGEANDKYTIARTVSFLIVANHVLSALEAAWNASRINNRIKLQGHIQSRRVFGGKLVEFVPTLQLEYEL
jgi:hypothetical protein